MGGRPLECVRDLWIRPFGSEGEVARMLLLVADEGCQPPMEPPPRDRVELLVCGGGKQRVREPQAIALGIQDARLEGRTERLLPASRCCHDREGRLRERCRGRKRAARRARESVESIAHELPELGRHGQGLAATERAFPTSERAAELECEEGVTACNLVDAAQCGARENQAEPGLQDGEQRRG